MKKIDEEKMSKVGSPISRIYDRNETSYHKYRGLLLRNAISHS